VTLQRRATIIVVPILLVLAANQADPHRVPMGTLLYGVLYGSLSGLLAIGLVLTYRVTRAINFAYGSMGAVAGAFGVNLYLGHHWPWGVTIVVALVIGGLVGAGVGALINWRFSNTPRLILTVATVGLAQLLAGISAYVPIWLHTQSAPIGGFTTGLNKLHVEINPVLFTGNELLIVILVPLAVVGVSWFLLRTDAGRAVRAIADNSTRARLIGIPAKRLLLAVWILSGVVAALTVMLQAPDQGVTFNAAAGPTLLLAPLAAAVVAKMESLWIAFVTAIGLGVLQSVIQLDVSKLSVSTVVFLVVVMLALLFQHRSQSRVDNADDSWSVGGALKPIPKTLSRLREVRYARVAIAAVFVGAALAIPHWLKPGTLDQVSVTIVFGMVAVSIVVLSGWGGTISLGQFALVGLGAITAGDLMEHQNLDLFLALAAGGLVAAVGAVILGLPALRVKGMYLAVTTLAFAVAADEFFFNAANFNSVLPASVLRPVLWQRFDLHSESDLYWLCLGMLGATIVIVRGVRRARFGRAVLASRDNLKGAEAAAIPTTRVRLTAFAFSGLIAGVAGGLYVVIIGTASSTNVGSSFPSADSLVLFSMAVIGGLTSVGGALTGVALFQWLGITYPNLQILLTGAGLLVVLMIFPAGLAGVYEQVRDRTLNLLARRKGISTSVWGDGIDVESDDTLVAVAPDPVLVASNGHAAPSESLEPALLRCHNVNAAYGPMQVLFGIDLEVHEGEIVALLGTNGAGKSSLLKSVMGLLPASRGTVTFAGNEITSESTERIVRRGLSMMPGGRGIFPSLTVEENLRVASWPLRKDKGAASTARDEAMDRFPILRERADTAAGNLSGGEQQMLSLGMAFLDRPRLLCIDELSLGLAPTVVTSLIEAVKDMHRQGTTIVIVEQSLNVALLVAERATFLEKGQVRFSGPSADLLARPDLLRAVFIGGMADEASAPTGETPAIPSTVDVAPLPERVTDHEHLALETRSLVKRYGGILATDEVSLSIAHGEIVGLIGHNGAGKTTLFDLVSGFTPLDGGQMFLEGVNITNMPSYQRSIGGLGRSFQEARLFPTLTVGETVKVALERHLINRDAFAAAFRLPASTDSELRADERVDEIIAMLGLEGYRDRPTEALSTGTRRIVELACIMAHRPSLLLLDEPTAGVTQAESDALGPLLRRVAADTGCAMMVIAHDMGMISSLCDRLVALELGSIIAEGTPSEVLSAPAVIASYLGTEEAAVATV
jgi:ABC-type branched-subunit amino acid transport system ATPase component/ABC-type branched-subunit amino acid transport system permease subunit